MGRLATRFKQARASRSVRVVAAAVVRAVTVWSRSGLVDAKNCAAGCARMTGANRGSARGGCTPMERSREFEGSTPAIRNWVWQVDRDEGARDDGLTAAERRSYDSFGGRIGSFAKSGEFERAAAGFARKTETGPGRSSRSRRRIRPTIVWPRCAGCWVSPPSCTSRRPIGARTAVTSSRSASASYRVPRTRTTKLSA